MGVGDKNDPSTLAESEESGILYNSFGSSSEADVNEATELVRGFGGGQDTIQTATIFQEAVSKVASSSQLNLLLKETASAMGATWFSLRAPLQRFRRYSDAVYLTNSPAGLIRELDGLGPRCGNDPISLALEARSTPVVWPDLLRKSDLTPEQSRFMDVLHRHGIRSGISAISRVPGIEDGIFSLAFAERKSDDHHLIASMLIIAPLAFETAMHLYFQRFRGSMSRAEATLSPRQRECLVLIAQGKSDWEAGAILGNSAQTVHGHIEAIRNRYGARRRTQLIVRALFERQISFREVL